MAAKLNDAYYDTVMAIDTLLWRLWKESSHAKSLISNANILDELALFLGEERLQQELEAVGPEAIVEFCDIIREYLNETRIQYYSGFVGSMIHGWERIIWRGNSNRKSLLASDLSLKDPAIEISSLN